MPRLVGREGDVSYNGIDFPSAIHTKIQGKPMYQNGEVHRKYMQYTLTVDTILTYTDPPLNAAVTSPQDMKTNALFYRRYLTEPGKVLTFTAQGFGDIIVNAYANNYPIPAGAQSFRDVAFGPKPRLLVWEPIGSNKAAHITWVCEFCIPDCPEGTVSDREVMEITHEVNFSLNQEGMVTRTIKATIEIAANRHGINFLDTVDDYVGRFNPPRLPNFHREINRHINRDHRIMEITYIDTEICSDNAYGAGLLSMKMSHTVGSTFEQKGFLTWMNSLTGTFRWEKGYPRSLAWSTFVAIVRERFLLQANVPDPNDPNKLKHGNIPHSINITEEIFDREASFTITYITIVNKIENLFLNTGLFKLINPARFKWSTWSPSVFDSQTVPGHARLKDKVSTLKVTDICNPTYHRAEHNRVLIGDVRKEAPLWFAYSCADTSPENSWVAFDPPTIHIKTESSVVPEFPAFGPPNSAVLPTTKVATAKTVGFDPSTVLGPGPIPSQEPVFQNRFSNEHLLTVTGSYVRICFEPYAPVFKAYGTEPLILHKNEFMVKKIEGQFFPIYMLAYKQQYHLAKLPPGKPLLILKHDAIG